MTLCPLAPPPARTRWGYTPRRCYGKRALVPAALALRCSLLVAATGHAAPAPAALAASVQRWPEAGTLARAMARAFAAFDAAAEGQRATRAALDAARERR